MLLTLVPLFDENMAVCAYSFFTQRENFLLNPLLLGTAQFDGASQITGLELIQKMGIDTLSQGKEIFVPISNISIFADIPEQCDAPHEKIVLLIDNTIRHPVFSRNQSVCSRRNRSSSSSHFPEPSQHSVPGQG